MRAALLIEPGSVEVGDVPDPEPGPGEVRIRVGGVGLCGSDLAVFSGRWKAPTYPWIMGHEAFGNIESVGFGVTTERIGQTVVVEPNEPCFACSQCSRGWTSACPSRQSLGMNRQGALAEFLVVPSRFAWSVPLLPAVDLVCVEPATVINAALRRLAAPPPESALVVGVGGQGLMMVLALLERGVAVYAHDVTPQRLAHVARLGALVMESCDTRRFDLVVDTVGSPHSVEVALDCTEVGGTLLCLGLDSRPLGLTARTLVRKQLRLRGSLTYDHPIDFQATTALLAEGRLERGRVVSDAYLLDEAQMAFERSGSTSGKSWIRVLV
jgi:alcohol dehydrogenase/L-iditol 2-dehydrogenase